MNSKKKGLGILSTALALVLGLALVISASAAGTLSSGDVSAIVDTSTDKSLVSSPFIQVANAVRESVVGVNNYQVLQQSRYGFSYGFGGNDRGAGEQVRATGSGVVISPYGHIITNYHVISGASRVTVTYGTKEAEATVVASDKGLDIAILLVPGIKLPAAKLGDSDQIQVGEWAIAIGNPLGQEFDRTVTVGVVSAYNRAIDSNTVDAYGRRSTVTNEMIQIDTAISSGNSGGGMFNILGQLQGIPTLKYDSQASFFSQGTSIDNIGMALPINAAKPLIKSALESYDAANTKDAAVIDQATGESTGETSATPAPDGPKIGVTVGTLNTTFSLVADGTLPQGAYVSEVVPGSPAETSGIKPGDIIVEVDGKIVKDHYALIETLTTHKAGDKVEIKLFRAENLSEIIQGSKDLSALGQGDYQTVNVELKVLNKSL
ncbi:MAG: S1C family serine protease [Christensenellales bacterium]